ncbi:MAG: hypothetical protein CVV44_23330 [Spirochaetae bacterium HGW-Spirochaetae-1]|nr:MAG: hypothetical protein CVV44_23330 [Spirochaetae bacterium HGW-Spirochaetae-1]
MKDIDDLLSDIDDGEYRGLGDLADADEAPPDNDSTAADEKDGDEFDVAEDDSPALDSPDNQASAISGGEENRENPIQPGLYNTMTFSVRGTQPWNTGAPYIMDISLENLDQDMEKLSRSFFFIQEPLEASVLDEELKRTMIIFMKKKYGILDTYSDFIDRIIIKEMEDVVSFFETGENKHLLLYHCGPETIHNILQTYIQEKHIGDCYYYLPDRRAKKFIPHEYLKQKILNWYEENVNTLQLDFDSMTLYKSIRQTIQNRYLEQKKKFNQAMDQVNIKAGNDRHITPAELLKKKGDMWFTSSQKCVYRRFLGNLSIDH